MRVAMICLERPGRLIDLACELGRQGHQVTLHTRRRQPGASREALAPGVVIDPVTAGPPQPLGSGEVLPFLGVFGQALAVRWAARPPDLVHAHGWASGLAALSGGDQQPMLQEHGLLAAHRGAYPAQTPATQAERTIQARLERVLGRSVGANAVGCCQDRDELIRLGVPRARIRIIPGGVDVHEFTRRGPAHPRGEHRRLLMMAGPGPEAGAEAAVRVLVGIPDAELVIAGGPPPASLETDPDAHRLRLQAKREGVEDRLILLGQVPRRRTASLIRSADLVLALGPYDPYGSIALDAMACGIPVVATPTGGHLDTVLDGVSGILLPALTPGHLTRTIRKLLANPTLLDALGLAGADRARSRHSWTRIAAETSALYQQIS